MSKKRNLVVTERKISFAARVIGLLPFFAILMSAISLKMAFDNRAVQREGIEFTIEDVEIVGDKYPLSLSITGRIVNISDVDVAVRRLKRWSRNFGPVVKVDRMKREVIQNEETKEPFA